jgi:hypothetical protein
MRSHPSGLGIIVAVGRVRLSDLVPWSGAFEVLDAPASLSFNVENTLAKNHSL